MTIGLNQQLSDVISTQTGYYRHRTGSVSCRTVLHWIVQMLRLSKKKKKSNTDHTFVMPDSTQLVLQSAWNNKIAAMMAEQKNREACLLTNTLQHTRLSWIVLWQGWCSGWQMSRSDTFSSPSAHTAGLTDISTAKIISLPDLSQAGQECVTGTACINILTHGSHSSTQAHMNTHRHTGAHNSGCTSLPQRRVSGQKKNTQARNQDFPVRRYWQSSVWGLQISNLLLFPFA